MPIIAAILVILLSLFFWGIIIKIVIFIYKLTPFYWISLAILHIKRDKARRLLDRFISDNEIFNLDQINMFVNKKMTLKQKEIEFILDKYEDNKIITALVTQEKKIWKSNLQSDFKNKVTTKIIEM